MRYSRTRSPNKDDREFSIDAADIKEIRKLILWLLTIACLLIL